MFIPFYDFWSLYSINGPPVDDCADKWNFWEALRSSDFELLVFFQALCILKRHKKAMNVDVSSKNGMRVSNAI